MTQPDDIRARIEAECDAVKRMLVSKNDAYGNSALDPVRIFSKADPEEQLRVRIDDKLSRLARGTDAGEDVELDLIGYLVLLRLARQMRAVPECPACHCKLKIKLGVGLRCPSCGYTER